MIDFFVCFYLGIPACEPALPFSTPSRSQWDHLPSVWHVNLTTPAFTGPTLGEVEKRMRNWTNVIWNSRHCPEEACAAAQSCRELLKKCFSHGESKSCLLATINLCWITHGTQNCWNELLITRVMSVSWSGRNEIQDMLFHSVCVGVSHSFLNF